MKIVKTPVQVLNNGQNLTKPQFYRLLNSEKGALEVCSDFFSKSVLLEDKLKTVEIASKVYRFAKGRKHESNAQKLLMWEYLILGGGAAAAAAIFKAPIFLIGTLFMTFCTYIISNYATITRPYASKIPPIFHVDDKILEETQKYLEHLEILEYKDSLKKKAIEMTTPKSSKPEFKIVMGKLFQN